MSEKTKAATTADEGVVVIERVFDAPRELVWKAWTDREMFVRWFGPNGYTTPSYEVDFRVGGRWLYCMRSAEGQDMWGTGTYREIVSLERFVSTSSLADENGNVVSASDLGMGEGMPLETLVTVTFEDLGAKTRMTLRHEGLPAGPMRDGAGVGWNQAFDKLAEVLQAA